MYREVIVVIIRKFSGMYLVLVYDIRQRDLLLGTFVQFL